MALKKAFIKPSFFILSRKHVTIVMGMQRVTEPFISICLILSVDFAQPVREVYSLDAFLGVVKYTPPYPYLISLNSSVSVHPL